MKKIMAVWIAVLLMLPAIMMHAAADPVQMLSLDEMPEVTDDGLLPDGENAVYYRDFEGGIWLYVDSSIRVEITRYQTEKPLLTYYLADILCTPGNGIYTVNFNEKKPGRTNGLPQDMAAKARAVYAQSGDFYSYRVANDRYPGNIVRDSKVLYNKSYSKMVHALPNLATIGFYPSGKAQVNEAWQMSAKNYVKNGASTVLAFGPILLRDGEIADELDDDAYEHLEPRSCFGVIASNHYVGLLVEGRKKHSDGATLMTCASILSDYGCWDAINLDGGNTAAMLFMGESVQMANNGGVYTNDRAIPDILCVGHW